MTDRLLLKDIRARSGGNNAGNTKQIELCWKQPEETQVVWREAKGSRGRSAAMTASLHDPLQVIICRDAADVSANAYHEALSRAFRGGDDMDGGYLAGGEDLDVPVLEFSSLPHDPCAQILDDALHTLLVVLLSRELLAVNGLAAWLDAGMSHIRGSNGRHGLLVFVLDGSGDDFRRQCPNSTWNNHISVSQLSEQSVAPAVAGLIALYNAYGCLASGTDLLKDRLKLFFSHAKLDGQPSAHALKALVDETPALKAFYDADDIPPGSDFEKILEKGVQDSVLVVLRTEAFETRPWCLKEVHWAERFSAPMVVVDLRCRLIHAPSALALDRTPNIRLPDGNFFRILYVAVREGVRAALLARQVQDIIDQGASKVDARILPRRPTMYALHNACKLLSNNDQADARGRKIIVYPDPPLPEGDFQAAMALVNECSQAIELQTPQSLIG